MMIADIYHGGPVGVETLAAGLSEPRDTIEEVIEPYLIQLGLIARTARGRCLNGPGWTHLGLPQPKGPGGPVRREMKGDDDEDAAAARLRPARRARAAAQAARRAARRRAVDYADEASWLCLPGRADACGAAAADDRAQRQRLRRGRPGGPGRRSADRLLLRLSDRLARSRAQQRHGRRARGAGRRRGPVRALRQRSAGRSRRIYRQATLGSIAAVLAGQDPAPVLDLAYGDVLAAWRHYLAHRNHGRPFVLIGHSQGTIHLIRLLAEEIEGRPEAARMLSALLIGCNVEVPEGQVGRRHLPHDAALHPRRPDRLRHHLRLVPRRRAAAAPAPCSAAPPRPG